MICGGLSVVDAHEHDTRDKDRELRRLAIQIAGQLPTDTHEALAVLRHCQTLIVDFMGEKSPSCVGVPNVSRIDSSKSSN